MRNDIMERKEDILKWIEENNFHISYAPFDVYESNPQDVKNPEELITQVWFPISK